jgi:RNA polymerase sigma factor (sigma-70 family)
MQYPDHKYLDALIRNDEPLIDELYKKFSGKIKRMVLQNHGNETDAADIFQDALLSICEKGKKQHFILTCPFDAFLYLICKNKWITELHKRKNSHVTFQDIESFSIGEDTFKMAEELALQQARKNLIIAKVSEMSESCKRLLELSWRHKSLKEVAKILGLKYGYVRKKKSECMAELIELVKQCPESKSLKW